MQSFDTWFFHFFHPHYRIAIAFILAVLCNLYIIPVIIRIAKVKKLFDVPDERKKHVVSVPTLGGLGIYATIVLISLIFVNSGGIKGTGITGSLTSLPSIIAGFTLIFFIGMKDDLLDISAWKKLAAEFAALLILVLIGDLRLSSMQGMFNIGTLSYPVSILLSIFAGIVIINAFNLIDGIDGLAASIAMLVTFIFGSYFFAVGDYEYAILASTIVGAIFPFYLYNAFGHVNKIFMGDTGSLILGFAMTILVFRFNEINTMPDAKIQFVAAPSFSFAVLILPMFDTIRVFVIRIYRGLSPFKADNRHIHHVLLDLGLTHFQSTWLLVSINFAFIAFAYFFNYLGNSVIIGIMILCAIILSMYAMRLRRRKLAMRPHKYAIE